MVLLIWRLTFRQSRLPACEQEVETGRIWTRSRRVLATYSLMKTHRYNLLSCTEIQQFTTNHSASIGGGI